MPVTPASVWTTPITWADNTPMDEDTLNEQIGNNLRFLKRGHLKIVRMPAGADITTTSTTMALVDADAAVEMIVEHDTTLFVGCSIPYALNNTSATIIFDLYEVNSGVYLSSFSSTPAANGLYIGRVWTANTGRVFSGLIPAGNVTPGPYKYELHWRVTANTGTIQRASHPVMLWLWGM